MEWLSPIWLLALAPWVVVSVWLFRGRRPRVQIPYLPLWRGPLPMRQPYRKLRTIPLAIAMALLASLLAILAGARPAISGLRSGGSVPPLVIVVDRGLSMSAQADGRTRYEQAARALARAIEPRDASRPVELVPVPGEEIIRTTLADCADRIASLPPTARDTRRAVEEAVSARLAASSAPVLVVSDQNVPGWGDRVLQVPPDAPVEDVAISGLTMREAPWPQVMVRVRNQSSLTSCTLETSTDSGTARQAIELPARGGTRDYFINPSRLGTVVSARILARDDVPANDQAWLVREGSTAGIEVRTPVPAELQRLINAYQRARPAADESLKLVVASRVADLPANAPGVIVADADQLVASDNADVASHSLTAHVDWAHVPSPVRLAREPPAGWTPVVKLGGRVAIAVAPEPARRVWVGFDSPSWPANPDFVVFWTNVFDWAGGAGRAWVSRPLNDWSPEWKAGDAAAISGSWPGVYRRSDGALRAFNAPDVIFPASPRTDWRSRLSRLERTSTQLQLFRVLLLLAAGAMAVSALAWRPAARPAQTAGVPGPSAQDGPA